MTIDYPEGAKFKFKEQVVDLLEKGEEHGCDPCRINREEITDEEDDFMSRISGSDGFWYLANNYGILDEMVTMEDGFIEDLRLRDLLFIEKHWRRVSFIM